MKKRIIVCLDVKNGRTVKGTNFVDLKDAGDPVELARKYSDQGIDELVFLDISASLEKRKTLVKLVEKIAQSINIPFTVGGGISDVEQAVAVVNAGADKIAINTAAVLKPELITAISSTLGSQAVVVAIDTMLVHNEWKVFTHGGQRATNIPLLEWTRDVEIHGAGEILLTSMNHDGTKNGFANSLVNRVSSLSNIPVIASGGAGSADDFLQLFKSSKVSAGLAAGIFHYGEVGIQEVKSLLKENDIQIR